MIRVFLALAAVGCAAEQAVEEPLTECGGAGDPTLTLGTGSLTTFAPFADGESVVLFETAGKLGLNLALLTTGLATEDVVTAVIKVAIDNENADAIASLSLQCPSEGPGWVQVFAPLPASRQGVDPATLSGLTLTLDGVATDSRDITASTEPVDLVVE